MVSSVGWVLPIITDAMDLLVVKLASSSCFKYAYLFTNRQFADLATSLSEYELDITVKY